MPLRAAGTHLRSPTNPAGLTSRAISKASRPPASAPCEAVMAGFARGEEACRAMSRRRTTTSRRPTTTPHPATDSSPAPASPAPASPAPASPATASRATGRGPARSQASGQDRAPGRWSATDSGLRTSAHSVRGGKTPSARVPRARGLRAAEFAARPRATGHPEPAGRARHVRLHPAGSPAPARLRSPGPAELWSAGHVRLRPAARDRIRPAGCRWLRRGGDRGLPSVRRGRSNPFRLVRCWRSAGLR